MSDLLFVCGRVRAQESKLLDLNKLDRMIGANSPEDAFRVFTELQYAEYIDESTSAKDFAKVITQGLLETKEMVTEERVETLEFIWFPLDINNIKRALKLKIYHNATCIDDFSQENGFSLLGDLSKEQVENLIWGNLNESAYYFEIIEVLNNVENILKENNQEFRFVEYALDQACFEVLSKRTLSNFSKKLLTFLIDSINIRNLARHLYIMNEPVNKQSWINNGTYSFDKIKLITSEDLFIEFIKAGQFYKVGSSLETETGATAESLIEKFIDKEYRIFLKESSLGEISGVSIPYNYFEQRMHNARLLKFIMFAKFNGIDADTIYDRISKF
jgi:vacuolar-type H+-ATPase subunit C/Vma6